LNNKTTSLLFYLFIFLQSLTHISQYLSHFLKTLYTEHNLKKKKKANMCKLACRYIEFWWWSCL